MLKKRGQVWIETVTYTLIGLTIIGAIMAVMLPRINQANDRIVIAQTIDSLNSINNQMSEVTLSSGSQREISLVVKKGEYIIDSLNNSIYYVLDGTNLLYSEPGEEIKNGDVYYKTEIKTGKKYTITLKLDYSNFNITYRDKDEEKRLTSAPTAYNLLIQNKDSLTRQINFEPF